MANITQVLPGIHPQIAIDFGGAVNHQPEFASACFTASAHAAVLDRAVTLASTAVAAATDDDQRERLLAAVTNPRAATRGAA